MGTLHCLRVHGFILLLIVSISSVSSLASKIDVSIYRDRKRILSSSTGEYTTCADHSGAKDGKPIPLNFDCKKGYVMSKINFADYGHATGSCGNFRRGKCGSSNALSIVQKKCLRKSECELFVPDKMFGPSHCKGPVKLVIDATCKKA